MDHNVPFLKLGTCYPCSWTMSTAALVYLSQNATTTIHPTYLAYIRYDTIRCEKVY